MDIRKFDIRASKYFILTGLLCLFFLLLVSNAFRYLPDDVDQTKLEHNYEQLQTNASDVEEEFVEEEVLEEDINNEDDIEYVEDEIINNETKPPSQFLEVWN